jgi:hypothetical protein
MCRAIFLFDKSKESMAKAKESMVKQKKVWLSKRKHAKVC